MISMVEIQKHLTDCLVKKKGERIKPVGDYKPLLSKAHQEIIDRYWEHWSKRMLSDKPDILINKPRIYDASI